MRPQTRCRPCSGRALCLLLAALGAGAGAHAAPPLIAVLASRDAEPYRHAIAAFEEHLRAQLPGVEFAAFRLDSGADDDTRIMEEIARRRPDLVYSLGSPATRLAAGASPGRPVVATLVLSPEDFIGPAAVTGVVLDYPPATQLQWLQRILPTARRVGVLYDPRQNQRLIDEAVASASGLGLEIVPLAVGDQRQLPAALKALARRADVLWAIADATVYAPQTVREVLLACFRSRTPVVGLSDAWVKAGALYALDRDYADLGAQSGQLALAVLRGTPARSIPPAAPRKVVYTLNRKTARYMNIDLPEPLVKRAAAVYE